MDKYDKSNKENERELFRKSLEINSDDVDYVGVSLNYWKEYFGWSPPKAIREMKGNQINVTIPAPTKENYPKQSNRYEFDIYFGKKCNYPYTNSFNLNLDSWNALKKEVDKLIKEAEKTK